MCELPNPPNFSTSFSNRLEPGKIQKYRFDFVHRICMGTPRHVPVNLQSQRGSEPRAPCASDEGEHFYLVEGAVLGITSTGAPQTPSLYSVRDGSKIHWQVSRLNTIIYATVSIAGNLGRVSRSTGNFG